MYTVKIKRAGDKCVPNLGSLLIEQVGAAREAGKGIPITLKYAPISLSN